MYGRVDLARSLESLGADDDVTRAELRLNTAQSLGKNTFLLGIEGGSLSSDGANALPFTLGGFGRLSGLGEERIVGRYLGLARLGYFRQVSRLAIAAIEMPMYAGFTCEAGQVWQTRDAVDADDLRVHGSIFFGLDSPVGPVYLGAGFGDEDERTAFLSIGRTF